MEQPAFGPAVVSGPHYIGLPITGTITALFGSTAIPQHAGGHTGLDIAAPNGSPVRAPAAGLVAAVREADPIFGNAVELAHPGGWRTLYAHLAAVDVRAGQPVLPGELLGRCGSTGLSTGPHLHWGLARGHSPAIRGDGLRDPLAFVAATPVGSDRERTLHAAAASLYAGLQAAGALFGSHSEADLAGYPPGSPERMVLAIQQAANPFLAAYLRLPGEIG